MLSQGTNSSLYGWGLTLLGFPGNPVNKSVDGRVIEELSNKRDLRQHSNQHISFLLVIYQVIDIQKHQVPVVRIQ